MPRKPKVKPDPSAMRRGPDDAPRNAGCGGGLCAHADGEPHVAEAEKVRGNDVQPPRQKPS
jgi:hypothetical protein